MNAIASLAIALALVAANAALAEVADKASSNPFSVAPNPERLIPGRRLEDEDASNPFVAAHLNEQVRFADYYISHYNIPRSPLPPSEARDLPPMVDAQGRPLWFDVGPSDTLVTNLLVSLFRAERFDDLDRLFDDWSDRPQRTADGRSMLSHFLRLSREIARANDWDAGYQIIRRWRDKRPKSRAAAIEEAQYWFQYAWNVRGNGDSSEVAAPAWDLYFERMRKAEAVLEESRPYAGSSPLWASLSIDIGSNLGLAPERQMEIFAEYTRTGTNYYNIYSSMLMTLTPDWGGSWRLVDEFIKDAVNQTKDREGQMLYARLYWWIDCRCAGFNLFRDTLATWPQMKQGFEDFTSRTPHSAWNVNVYAAYACLAGDKDAYRKARYRIGALYMREAWRDDHSIDVCDHELGAEPL